MNYRVIAERIPDNVRSQRLICEADPIDKAIAVQTNYAMQLLFAVWFEFVEPNGEKNLGCPSCLQNVLNNFVQMKGALIELEKEYQLLKSMQ